MAVPDAPLDRLIEATLGSCEPFGVVEPVFSPSEGYRLQGLKEERICATRPPG